MGIGTLYLSLVTGIGTLYCCTVVYSMPQSRELWDLHSRLKGLGWALARMTLARWLEQELPTSLNNAVAQGGTSVTRLSQTLVSDMGLKSRQLFFSCLLLSTASFLIFSALKASKQCVKFCPFKSPNENKCYRHYNHCLFYDQVLECLHSGIVCSQCMSILTSDLKLVNKESRILKWAWVFFRTPCYSL